MTLVVAPAGDSSVPHASAGMKVARAELDWRGRPGGRRSGWRGGGRTRSPRRSSRDPVSRGHVDLIGRAPAPACGEEGGRDRDDERSGCTGLSQRSTSYHVDWTTLRKRVRHRSARRRRRSTFRLTARWEARPGSAHESSWQEALQDSGCDRDVLRHDATHATDSDTLQMLPRIKAVVIPEGATWRTRVCTPLDGWCP